MLANERSGTIHLDHGEPSASGRNCIAFPCVGLLSNPQRVQLRLEGGPIDYFGCSKFISHKSVIVLSVSPTSTGCACALPHTLSSDHEPRE